ncbi:Reverse transcriptase (RNA-dependent DNA polymerase) [Popillia japonica]|uniref:Reverse transcriptase (RNA-dependent DNA polymerase) n=1 Tax=Popillia japonica TaxID=7064 RepID=A0AAW1N2Z3_POPJA
MEHTYHIQPFDLRDNNNTSGRWEKWIARFDNYLVATNIKCEERKKAMLLHFAGEDVFDLYVSLPDPPDNVNTSPETSSETSQATGSSQTLKVYELAKQKLNMYFKPKLNLQFEIFKFRQAKQESSENIDQFYARLLKLSKTCNFNKPEDEIKCQIILNTTNSGLRRGTFQVSNQKCKNCGNNWHSQGRQSCPAIDVTCFKCNRTGHFAKVCLSKAAETKRKGKQSYVKDNKPRVNNTDAVEQNSDEESFNIHMYSVESTKTPRIEVIIDKTPVTCIIDSGSSVNVVSADTFYKLNDKLRLSKDNTKIYAYNSKQQLPLLGFFESKVSYGKTKTTAKIFVVKGHSTPLSNQKCKNCGHSTPLLSYETAVKLGILHITFSTEMTETKIIKDKFPELFQGTGKLKGNEVHLFIDPTVVPVAQKHRRLPFSIRDKVKEELKRLEQNDIIELVTTPTPWLSPIVVVPKPNNTNAIRIKLDLKDGYHQLVLDKQSRGITSFSTHVGTYRYKRLNFGINAAAEIFQDTVRQVLVGIAGVINVSDDILVFGKSKEEHDVALESVLERLKQSGLTLNERKCAFMKTSIHFLGFIFSDKGIAPDPKKVEAINNLDPPKNPSEVRSLLGMFNYVGKFIRSTKEPIRGQKFTGNVQLCW